MNSPFFRLGLAMALLLSSAAILVSLIPAKPSPAETFILPAVTPENYVADCNDATVYHVSDYELEFEAMRPVLPPKNVLQLPVFPGCEGVDDYKERVFCGFGKFRDFIYDNVRYPEGGTDGLVVVKFTVGKDTGKVSDLEVVRSPHPANSKEALRVMRLLQERDVRFSPGKVRGQPACMRLAVPIRFTKE